MSGAVDVRQQFPFDAAYLPWPVTAEKTSVTVHWPGAEFDAVTDDDVLNLLYAFAEEHIAKDWALEIPGVQHGAGIMYAEAIAPSGTVFLMRDPDAVLWHSNTSEGNSTSRPILVVCSKSRPPTPAQLLALRSRLAVHGLPAFPHSKWTSTQCPGDALRAFLNDPSAPAEKEVIVATTPTLNSQGAALQEIPKGGHATLQAVYQYAPEPSGETRARTIIRKVTSTRPGLHAFAIYPPVDPDDDESIDLDAEPALFLVNVLP